LKINSTLRPAPPPAKPLIEPPIEQKQPVTSGKDNEVSSGDNCYEGSDRYSAAHAQLDAMTVEIEQSETSWRTVVHSRDDEAAELDGGLNTLVGDVDASVDKAIIVEIDRHNDASEDMDNADARYDVAPNVELFTEIQGMAQEKGFLAISEEMGLTNAVLGDLRALNLV